MIILISGITGFNEPKTQDVFLGRVCVYVHTDATILGDACTHWLSGPEDFFNISPRRCSLHLQTRIVYLSGLTLVTNCGPGARHREGEGVAKGAARGAVDDEGEKNCVDRSRRIRDRIHGTTRVHATWFARCYEIIPLLLPLPLLSSFLFPLPLSLAAFHRRLSGNRLLSLRPFVIFGKKNAWNSLATKKRFNRDFFDLSTLRTTTTTTTSTTITTSLELSLAYVYGFSSYIV